MEEDRDAMAYLETDPQVRRSTVIAENDVDRKAICELGWLTARLVNKPLARWLAKRLCAKINQRAAEIKARLLEEP